MRKYVIGFIVGAVLMYSGQAVAGSISKIGKKVQAEYTIKVDGKTLDTKALSIDGQTTTPNRPIADAVGYDVKFENNEVLFTKKVGGIVPVETNELSDIDKQIEDIKRLGKPLDDKYIELSLEVIQHPEKEAEINIEMTELIRKAKELKEKIKALETQKAELEAKQ